LLAQSASDNLKSALQNFLRTRSSTQDETTRYFEAFIDLDDDGQKEAVVHVVGRPWCSSVGCTTLVLQPQGSTYRVVTRITATRLPIRILAEKSYEWRSLAVSVGGGGIPEGAEVELPFDGVSYPFAPNQFPARPLADSSGAETLIPAPEGNGQAGKPLFP
jgi:hypothetical protein